MIHVQNRNPNVLSQLIAARGQLKNSLSKHIECFIKLAKSRLFAEGNKPDTVWRDF